MLDAFLEVVSGHTKQAQARARHAALLERLPTELLQKIADGALPKEAGDDGCWLDKFRGSPLLDQAIAIEKEELDLQMQEADRRRQETELRASLPTWDETDLQRSELAIKRKLLELELVGADVGDAAGGQEGEDVAPPDLEAAEPAPPAAAHGAPPAHHAAPPHPSGEASEGAEEAPPEQASAEEEKPPKAGPPVAAKAEGEGSSSDEAASEDKPKPKPPVTKVTKETTEKPAEEKIDIKAASARMRMALAARVIKEAQPANRAGAFRRV